MFAGLVIYVHAIDAEFLFAELTRDNAVLAQLQVVDLVEIFALRTVTEHVLVVIGTFIARNFIAALHAHNSLFRNDIYFGLAVRVVPTLVVVGVKTQLAQFIAAGYALEHAFLA